MDSSSGVNSQSTIAPTGQDVITPEEQRNGTSLHNETVQSKNVVNRTLQLNDDPDSESYHSSDDESTSSDDHSTDSNDKIVGGYASDGDRREADDALQDTEEEESNGDESMEGDDNDSPTNERSATQSTNEATEEDETGDTQERTSDPEPSQNVPSSDTATHTDDDQEGVVPGDTDSTAIDTMTVHAGNMNVDTDGRVIDNSPLLDREGRHEVIVSQSEEQKDEGEEKEKVWRQQKLTNLGFSHNKNTKKLISSQKTVANRSSNISFASSSEIHHFDTTNQDELNTIHSGETSIYHTLEEAEVEVPLPHIRYRLTVILEKVDISAIINGTDTEDKEMTPTTRARQIFIELLSFVQSNIDHEALLVSWKNDNGFSVMPMEAADDFPKELEKVAKFFDGYKTNLKAVTRSYFKFCIHSPNVSDDNVESKLLEWKKLHSFTLYKCMIQAENSRVIGWLVYTYSFTNENAIKRLLQAQTDHEWGLRVNVITTADKETKWKNRLKAIQIMVPSDKAETAKDVVSALFSQTPSGQKYRSLQDSYMFLSNEKACHSDKLATIYTAMVGRHKFRLINIDTVLVEVIIKDIATRITTKMMKPLP